jgi:hypothetical protein
MTGPKSDLRVEMVGFLAEGQQRVNPDVECRPCPHPL